MKTYIVFNLLYLFWMQLKNFVTGIYNQARSIVLSCCRPTGNDSSEMNYLTGNDSLDQVVECYEAEVDISKSTTGRQNLGGFRNDFHSLYNIIYYIKLYYK